MKSLLVLALPLLAGCVASSAGDAAVRVVPIYNARTFFETVQVTGGKFNAKGTHLLLSSDESGVFNVYRISVDGGPLEPLTLSRTDACYAVDWFPTDDRFLYSKDQGGNELDHVFAQEIGGLPVDLTPGENLKAQWYGWSGDKLYFFVATNERDPRHFDLYRYASSDYARDLVFQNDGGFELGPVSRDGRWLALSKERTNADSDVHVQDLLKPKSAPALVTRHEGDVQHAPTDFTPDSKSLLVLSDEGSEHTRLWSLNLETFSKELMIEAPWDVTDAHFSESGRYRIAAVNVDAHTEVQALDVQTNSLLKLPEIPRGDVTALEFDSSDRLLTFLVNGDTSPSNLYVLDLQSGVHRQLTKSLSLRMDANHLVESTNVRYSSFDGLEIPALLYRPHPASSAAPLPALVWVHGGPGGQCRSGYNPMIQFLTNHGIAVLAVNNRGSSGYGKTFFHMDDRRHGDVDLQDCVYGRRYLETLPWVDRERVGIMGGSYGGYMVCAALAFEPLAFDVGIDLFGVTNWLRTLENIPSWWASFRDSLYAEMGDPATDRERLHKNSPLFHAANIQRPLLVIQGANDPRVLQVESDEIVQAVKKNRVPVEYVIFPDEGHGFEHKENRIKALEAIDRFLEAHLRK